jgi:putative ABC transport system permease protein
VDGLVVLLAASVGLLLLLATTNAASLLLTRVRSRRRELAVRVALGASRARVVGHLAAESALLALAGGLVGILLAWGLAAVMPLVAGSYIPRLDEVSLGGRTLAFTALLAASSWLLFGLASSLRGSPDAGLSGLKDGGRSATEGAPTQRLQRLLVAAQIAVAVPLLAASGLIATSMRNLQRAEPGFEVDGLLTFRVSLAGARYPDAEMRRGLWWDAEERVASLPGVLSVGVSDSRPPIEAYNYNNFDLEDRPAPVGENQPLACWISADAGYLETLGVALLEGRSLTRDDESPDAPPVIVVDETWARRHFPGESAVGRRLREGGATSGPWTTVVGVVGDVTYAGFGGDTGGTVYAPWTDLTQAFVVVRAAGDPAALLASLRQELRALEPTAPITDVATGGALISSSLAEPRHLTVLLIAFSALALCLAVIGVYGATAHAVQSRRGDIAVRLALGGTPRRVLGMVVRSTMRSSLAGMLAGALAARAFTPLLGGVVYRVDPRDPATLVAVVTLLAMVSLAACSLPAWRAVRLDPGATLRQE